METKLKKEDLREFEKWCVDTYKAGELRSPLHLSGGNEEHLIAIFKDIHEDDWIYFDLPKEKWFWGAITQIIVVGASIWYLLKF